MAFGHPEWAHIRLSTDCENIKSNGHNLLSDASLDYVYSHDNVGVITLLKTKKKIANNATARL